MLEGVLVVRGVIGGSRYGRVFTSGKGGWNANYGDRGRKEWGTQGGAVKIESLKLIDCGGVVGECLSRSAIIS